MKGSYRIVVENKNIRYDFNINRNITIIKGDSATGKTTLIEMISDYYDNGESSGIRLACERNCAVLSGKNWNILLNSFHHSIYSLMKAITLCHQKNLLLLCRIRIIILLL